MDTCHLRAATRNLRILEGGISESGWRPLVRAPAVRAPACRSFCCISSLAAIRLRDWDWGGFATSAKGSGQALGRHLICQVARKRRFNTRCQADDQVERSDGLDSKELMDSLRKAKERQRMAVIFETEGVLTDIHRRANREAYNLAFKDLDLDCANWTEPVYKDLYRSVGGDEERMLQVFFDRIGWPLAVPTNERKTFTRTCQEIKKKHLESFIEAGRLPLRPGVAEFVQEAASEGVSLIILGVSSRIGYDATRKLVEGLGDAVRVISNEDVRASTYAQVATGEGALAGTDNMLARQLSEAVNAEKQRLAEMVAEKLKLTVDLDTGGKSEEALLALRAAAEVAGTPVGRCVLLAGSHVGVQAAGRISMPCVVVKSSYTAGAEFPGALATYGDYGMGSGVTLAKLRRGLEKFHL